jgi:hypothetical protein
MPSFSGQARTPFGSIETCSWCPARYSPLEDERSLREPSREIALLDENVLERARRGERVEHRRAGAAPQLDARSEQRLAVRVREQQHRLFGVPDFPLDEARLILGDQ